MTIKALDIITKWYQSPAEYSDSKVYSEKDFLDYIMPPFLSSLLFSPFLLIVYYFSSKGLKKKHNKANESVSAEYYIPERGFNILNMNRDFIRSYETRTKVVSNSSSSGSHHRSGSSHRSSGGRRSGGGGRRF